MRYTYGIAIPTFNGAHRVETLIRCLDKCPSMNKIVDKVIVEDKMPDHMESTANHAGLLAVVRHHPEWRLVSLEQWSNMQGTAQKCMEECKTDFVWMISDDVVCAGDPFKLPIYYLENADKQVTDHIGGMAVPVYHANTHLKNDGIFQEGTHWHVINQFYADPFNGWLKDMQPIHYDTRYTMLPGISGQMNGATYVLRRKAWEDVGGFDLTWDVLDQYISYQIYFKTDYFILILNADPFYHAGGCAQNAGWEELRPRSKHAHSDERCKEIFGDWILEVEAKSRAIAERRQLIWGPIINKDFYDNLENSGMYKWRWV